MKFKEMSNGCPDALYLEEFAQSNQSKHIQKRHLYDIVPDPINMVSSMIVLESIEIDLRYSFDAYNNTNIHAIKLTQSIDSCPEKLTTLTITYSKLIFNQLTTYPTCIQHLSLKNIELTPDLARKIETGFSHLSTLELEGEITGYLTTSLPNHHFKKVILSVKYAQGDTCGLLVKTKNEGKSKEIYPTCDVGLIEKIHLNNEAIRLPTKAPFLTFICASIEKLDYSIDQKYDDDP